MVKATYKEFTEEGVLSLWAEGHAGYAPKGQDIVCAAVSALMQSLAYSVGEDEGSRNFDFEGGTVGRSLCVQARNTKANQAKFELVADGLELLAAAYPEHVQMVNLCGNRTDTINLQLFADGGADGGAPAGEGSGAAEGAGSIEPPMRPAEEKLARCSGVLKRTGKGNLSGAAGEALQKSAGPAGPLSHAARDSSPTKGSHWQDGEQHQTAQAQSGAKERALLSTEESVAGLREQGQEAEEFSTEEGKAVEEKQQTPEERKKAFHAMLQGEYRAETEELMNQAVERAAQLLENSPPVRELMNALSEAYGVDPNDLEALTEAVKNGQVKDEAYYEKLAMEKGISVATARQMDKLESENRRLSAAERFAEDQRKAAQRQAEIAQIHAAWDREAEQLKAQYPDFDLEATLANPEVADLMRRGVSMSNAYRAVYFDQIMAQNESRTAKQVEDGVTERIRQRGARPSENGTRPGGAAQTHTDVNALTRKEREQLERAALRGQVITF